MRHGVKRSKFNRNMGERKALLRSLLVSFFTHERIVTTEAKAKLLKPAADYAIHKAKTHDVATKRLLLSYLPNQEIVQKLLDEYGPRYKDRNGGYSKIVKLGRRMSDASPMARIELIGFEEAVVEEKPSRRKEGRAVVTGEVENAEVEVKASKVTPKKEGKASQRAGKTVKEKAVSKRQTSTRREGKK